MQENEEKLLDKIYKMQEEEVDKIIKLKSKELKNENNYNNLEGLLKEEKINKEEVTKILSNIEENYNKKINSLIEEFYKEGFKDGVKLIINCIK